MKDTGESKFYDKVAKKFGEYSSGAKFTQEFPTSAPEEVFEDLVLKSSGVDKNALDVGCADGRFALSLSNHFKNIVGLDMSDGMLNSAQRKKAEAKTENVDFVLGDASKIPFADQYTYYEYYPTYQDLELFLQGVPIFEDFDPAKDHEKLEEYVKTHTSPKGIVLPRHRIVIGATKI